ncbi:DgyrCDS372 [Dimorphilus gyrociliatus]|uniref:isopentenyl-diphosphate Delta-isomerase n=1 Tax=Dimorphilus gyrociliatus TaxID=2664684 RepID=A0A7I8V5L4_9ANNE|nr:DgyrCDS372 [Dimorphilus gyrociliatus]
MNSFKQGVTVMLRNSFKIYPRMKTPVLFNVKCNFFGSCKLMTDSKESHIDAQQWRYLDEMCIVIDEKDKNIGKASKRECHKFDNIEKGLLHRAFSVILFNSSGELLLQQRSEKKITYPGYWTNSCCSHPLATKEEMEENDEIGVKRAARRKLNHELGIAESQIDLNKFEYLTKIHYKADNGPENSKEWGEHEIDYCLVYKGDVTIRINRNEVKNIEWITRKRLAEIIEDSNKNKMLVTPWFKLMAKIFINEWWDNLEDLSKCYDKDTIHKFA